MRIALVANRFPVVSETFIQNHALGLRARGLHVTIVASRPSTVGDAVPSRHEYDGPVRYVVLGDTLGSTAGRVAARTLESSARARAIWSASKLRYGLSRRAVRAWAIALSFADFDVVHFEYSGLALAYMDAIPLLEGASTVVSCRGTQERIMPVIDSRRATHLRELFAMVDRVHCVSQDMLDTCSAYGLDTAKAFVNRPAIDIRRFSLSRPRRTRSRGPYKLVSTGRLHWTKGLECALLAVRLLVDQGYDVHLEIVGDGPERESVGFAIADLRLGARVALVGRKPPAEVRSTLESADVFVLTSVSEGISNAVLEAMAMELPIVTTDAGGMREAIAHGSDGLVVPKRDPSGVARAIASLLEDPELRARMGGAARRRVERDFSLERQISTFVAEYEALVEGAGA